MLHLFKKAILLLNCPLINLNLCIILLFSRCSNVTSLRKSNLVVKLSIDKAEPMYHSLFSRCSNVTSLRKSNLVVKLSIDKAEPMYHSFVLSLQQCYISSEKQSCC